MKTRHIHHFQNSLIQLALALVFTGAILLVPSSAKAKLIISNRSTFEPTCENPGWFPSEFGLKDHSVFLHDGYFYLVSINQADESYFVYARSEDLCDWEELSPTLTERVPGAWDELVIWAPHVYEEEGVHYLFYTGVNSDFTQSIMLATSTNPADPTSWQPVGMVFQPQHDGMVWEAGVWADCRDASVFKIADQYYMYYTGKDITGGIIGLATAPSPSGPWQDWGAILTLDGQPSAMPESPTLINYSVSYYLFYNDTQNGEKYRIGNTPSGPWSNAYPFSPGWAHEIWLDQEGNTFTSFLTDYTVTIAPLSWDTVYEPPRPFIVNNKNLQFLPVIIS